MNFKPLAIFWVIQDERNENAFEGVDDVGNFERIINRWFQTLDFSNSSHFLYSMKDLGVVVDILVDI